MSFIRRIVNIFKPHHYVACEFSENRYGINAVRYSGKEKEAYIQGYKDGYLQGMLKQQSTYQ